MKESVKKESATVYELGFHLIPTVAPEQVAGEFSAIKDLIEKNGGEFISEESPKLRTLSYEITKKINNMNVRFSTAYFGWVKFEISKDALSVVKESVEKNDKMLIYILINTVKENTLIPSKYLAPKDGKSKKIDTQAKIGNGEVKPISKEEEAEIEKTIDELVS